MTRSSEGAPVLSIMWNCVWAALTLIRLKFLIKLSINQLSKLIWISALIMTALFLRYEKCLWVLMLHTKTLHSVFILEFLLFSALVKLLNKSIEGTADDDEEGVTPDTAIRSGLELLKVLF